MTNPLVNNLVANNMNAVIQGVLNASVSVNNPAVPVQPSTPPGSKTLIYAPQVRIVIASGGKEIDVSKDVIRGRVVRAVDAVSQAEFYLNNKNGKYTGQIRRMDKVVIWMKRVTWMQVFTGYMDIVPALDLFPTEAYFKASCTLKRVKYTYWDKSLPASIALLNPQAGGSTQSNNANQAPDGATGIIVNDLLTKVGNWPANQVLIQQIPTAFMDMVKKTIVLVDQQDVFNRIVAYLQSGGVAGGTIYPWTTSNGNEPVPTGAGGAYTQQEVISLVKWVLGGVSSGVSTSKMDYFAAYIMATSGGDPDYHAYDSTSGRDMYGLLGLDHHTGGNGAVLTLDQLKDPVANIKQAWIASSQGTNFTYWSSTLGLGNPPNTISSVMGMSPGISAYVPPSLTTAPASNTNGNLLQTLFDKFYSAQAPEDVQTVINFAEQQLGKPYGTPAFVDSAGGTETGGGVGTDGTWDCSGLVMVAYSKVGVTLPHNAEAMAQATFAYRVPKSSPGLYWQLSDLQAGDVVFFPGSAPDAGGNGVPAIGHVGIYIGNDQFVEATGPAVRNNPDGMTKHLNGSTGLSYNVNFVTRPIGMKNALNNTTGTWQNTNENGGVSPDFALFNFLYQPATFGQNAIQLSMGLTGDFAPANDESLLTSVAQICQASMRSFMSGPNGDFIAFFPDYFGINNTKAVWNVEDVEIVDLKLQINDDELVTHVYTIGDTQEPGVPGSITVADWLASSGYVSIMSKAIMSQVLSMQSNTGFLADPTSFLQRYGIRPMTNQLSIIRSHYYEFFASLYTFLQQWSKQYSTQVSVTFMPELYPGMRINLTNHNLCVYVESLVHVFDYQNGFQTYPTISCPSTPGGGAEGLPIALGL